MAEGLLPFDLALERMLALGTRLPAESVPLAAASGRHLAADIIARLTQPSADVSAMDGYALRFADLPGPLRLIGEAAAGQPLGAAIGTGEAARIFTGAHLPCGADTVAVQEDALLTDGGVAFPGEQPPGRGAHVRAKGLDFGQGRTLAHAGDRLSPGRLGLLAAAGHALLPVHRRPEVAILSTGDELVPPGTMPGPGQVVGSNGLMVGALLAKAGADVTDLGIVADDRAATADAIDRAAGADLLVTIGGASVGDHDLVKPAFEAAGAVLDFWRVAIRPGKPLLAGRMREGAIVVGLPGNPVSAFVCARLFLMPLLRHMAGSRMPLDRLRPAETTVALGPNGPRRDFMRARLETAADGLKVTPFPAQDSSLLSVLADADALLVRPEHAPPVPAGASVPVLTL